MDVRIVDLDGSVGEQHRLVHRARDVCPLKDWGPRLRLACSWSAFARFKRDLSARLSHAGDWPALTFLGSGDFHHLSLALLKRLSQPCNLLVIDNHPDWMRGVPFLHCGTWVYHAARLPMVKRIFHVGGDVDFDNYYRWLAPWELLRSGKIVVIPALRQFESRAWEAVPHRPLREHREKPIETDWLAKLLGPFHRELARAPLYVSLDRDVLRQEHAVVNWDSGHLVPREVFAILQAFQAASPSLAGMDVVGDWSPVRVAGWGRKVLDWVEHPELAVDPVQAQQRNEALNLALVNQMRGSGRRVVREAVREGAG